MLNAEHASLAASCDIFKIVAIRLEKILDCNLGMIRQCVVVDVVLNVLMDMN